MRVLMLSCASLLLAGRVSGDGRKPPNVTTDSGKTFVASLRFIEAEIAAEETTRVRYKVGDDDKRHYLERGAIRAFDEESVSEEPLRFVDEPEFDPGEKVRIARAGHWVYVMRSGHSTLLGELASTEAADRAGETIHLPTPEEVKYVLKLDSEERQKEFEQLDEETRRELLIAAGNIAGIKDVPPTVSIKTLNHHIELFEKHKIRDWLVGLADDAGGETLVHNLKTPRPKWEAVKMAFAGLNHADQKTCKTIAAKLKARGATSLKPDEKKFIARNPLIFGGR